MVEPEIMPIKKVNYFFWKKSLSKSIYWRYFMLRQSQKVIKIVFFVFFLLSLISCGSRINQDNYEKVQSGMTEAKVKKILGEPNDSQSIGFGPLSGTTSTWKNKGISISIQFVNGKVKLKNFSKIDPGNQ